MTAATLRQIFHPFGQANQSLKRGRWGARFRTGIRRGLVGLYGGRVSASSRGLGSGSTLVVELPAEVDEVNLNVDYSQ